MLNYKSFGKGKLVTVFLHGFMGDIHSFDALIGGISGESRVIVVDFGFHKELPRVLSLNDYAEMVKKILDKEGVLDAIFVCHSFGGRVGVRLSKLYPQVIKGMVLISSAGLKPRRRIGYYFRVYLHKFLKKLGKSGLKGSLDYRSLTPNQKGTFIKVVNDFTDGDLSYIGVEVLLIWGSKDLKTPLYMARRYLRKLPRARLVVFRKAGHFCYLERRSETLSLIRAYISKYE